MNYGVKLEEMKQSIVHSVRNHSTTNKCALDTLKCLMFCNYLLIPGCLVRRHADTTVDLEDAPPPFVVCIVIVYKTKATVLFKTQH